MASSVFLLGPGYVGREIIDLLLAEKYKVTTIVRREAAGEELRKDGVTPVIGDLDDKQLITKLAKEADIVFHTATADHLDSAQAILDGVTARANEGKSTIYLHQSGASVLSDGSAGDHLSDKVYSDLRPEELDALADDAPHRKIDLALLKVRQELQEKAKIFIMMPPIIYGNNKKYQRLSIQVPTLTRFAIKNGYAGHAGKGLSAWGTVHVLDLARAYILILHWLERSPPSVGLDQPYFFCESGETTWKELAAIIGEGLHSAKKLDDPSPKTIPKESYGDLFGDFTPDVVGCNCRHTADRVRELGWEPTELSLRAAFEAEDLPVLLQEKGFKSSGLTLS